MIRETSAGIVLFRRSGSRTLFLLLHYPSGHWDFVRGKMEGGETALQTALRETTEETGITDVSFVGDFEEWIRYSFQHDGEPIYKKVVFFLAETGTDRIQISHEHLDYTWLEYNEAMKKTTFENAKRVLTRAQALLLAKGAQAEF